MLKKKFYFYIYNKELNSGIDLEFEANDLQNAKELFKEYLKKNYNMVLKSQLTI